MVALATVIAASRGRGPRGLEPADFLRRIATAAAVTYVLITASFLPGMYFLRRGPPLRGHAVPMLALVAAAVFAGFLLGRLVIGLASREGEASARLCRRRVAVIGTALLPLLVLAAVLPATVRELGRHDELSAYASAWDRRDLQIEAARAAGERDLVIEKLERGRPDLEIPPDATHWVNQCVADYYGVDTVSARP